MEEIVVTPTASDTSLSGHIGNATVVEADEVDRVGHAHIHELASRVPGAWISRGSGQEHLTAIRSPVLTGAGSCGAFLFLEDGIPVRPAGFCNVNQLFEINTEQADSIEIIRGPGSSLYGSNALHGIINVLSITDRSSPGSLAKLSLGPNDYRRVSLQHVQQGDARSWGVKLNTAHDGGFRDMSGFDQSKLNLHVRRQLAHGDLTLRLSATDLDQETAGFVLGQDAYRDEQARTSNPNPEAFRDADAQRLSFAWHSGRDDRNALELRGALRRSRMEFLQHFLPGQPLEENGQDSLSLLGLLRRELSPAASLIVGADLDISNGFLRETQALPTTGSPFLQATRPQGKHYDYDVDALSVAPYLHYSLEVGDRWHINAGLRLEWLRFEYDNLMLDGNSRDDGTVCGFGGCLYNRPADRADRFTNVAPKLGLAYELGENGLLYGSLSSGFRAPQATELYRLQRGQQVIDLDSERLDSIELGYRTAWERIAIDLAAFAMRKRDFIFRDAAGLNVSDGATRHTGLEYRLVYRPTPNWEITLNGTQARHRYRFDRNAALGEIIVSGNDVDTAPHSLVHAGILWQPSQRLSIELEGVHQDQYYLDAANSVRYPGHQLLNLRGRLSLGSGWMIGVRVNNLSDKRYADRADFAFGNYRYFPGRERELFVDLVWARAPEGGP